MKYGIFSDVHSNLEAFEAVIHVYQQENIDRFIFLGDIVGYGADPLRVIDLLKSLDPICVMGNHDAAVIGSFSTNKFNSWAKSAISWTVGQLDQSSLDYLGGFKLVCSENDFIGVHGTPDRPGDFNYMEDADVARTNFSLFDKQICFVGHSHVMEAYILDMEDEEEKPFHDVMYTNDSRVELNSNDRYIINVGSVGQPRDLDPRACLCIYDTDANTVIYKRVDYDFKTAAEKIRNAGLPEFLAERLYRGR